VLVHCNILGLLHSGSTGRIVTRHVIRYKTTNKLQTFLAPF